MIDNIKLMKHSDLPINDYSEDKLNFEPFVKKVSNGIKSYSQTDCFILSIEGTWGSGKTSFIKLLEKEIKEEVILFHFNPWLITDIKQLVEVFFEDLIKVLSHDSFKSKWDNQIKKDLKTFARTILPDKVNIGLSEGIKGTWDLSNRFTEKEKTLNEQKEKINFYLKDFKKRIVIVIDDIDRLMDNEIELVFRLIKGIADFDNITYLLSFDRSVVSLALEKYKTEKGEKYLDKIIQYPIVIPKSQDNTIIKILTDKLDKYLNTLGSENFIFSEDRWSEVHILLKKYIRNIRDINKIFDSFAFEYYSLSRDINFVDFFVLTLIRIQNYKLYEFIKNYPEYFIPNLIDTYMFGIEKSNEDKLRKKLIEIVSKKIGNFDEYLPLIEIIFPSYSKYSTSFIAQKDYTIKIIADQYYFDTYFSMSVSNDKLTTSKYFELETLLTEDSVMFKEKIKGLNKTQLSEFFSIYEDKIIKKRDEQKLNEIKIIIELVKEKEVRDFRTDMIYEEQEFNFYSWIRAVGQLLLAVEEKNMLFNFIEKLRNDHIMLYILRYLEDLTKKQNNEHYQNIIQNLKVLISKEINNLTFDEFIANKFLDQLVFSYNWIGFNFNIFRIDFEKKLFENKDSFFILLEKFVYKQISMPKKEHPYSISKESLKSLVDIKKVEEYIDNLTVDTLTNEQKIILDFWKNSKDW